MTSDELMEMALAASADARERMRDEFQQRWGSFRKCTTCGAPSDDSVCTLCNSSRVAQCGYTPPRTAVRLFGYSHSASEEFDELYDGGTSTSPDEAFEEACAAIQKLADSAELKAGDEITVHIGEFFPFDIKSGIDAWEIVDGITEAAGAECGEAATGFLLDTRFMDMLKREIAVAVGRWFRSQEKGWWPSFPMRVERVEVRKYTVR